MHARQHRIKRPFQIGAIVAAGLAAGVSALVAFQSRGITGEVLLSALFGVIGSGMIAGLGYAVDAIDRLRQKIVGTYDDTRSAIEEFAKEMPMVDEVIFVAYITKMLGEDLRALDASWRIGKLRVLIRDMEAINPTLPGEIPREQDALENRIREGTDAIRTINSRGAHVLDQPAEIHYFRGLPCLRGLLIRKKGDKDFSIGFISVYQERIPKDNPVDFSARRPLAPVLRLSCENPYEEALLKSFKGWFEFVWEKGSYSKQHPQAG